MSSANLNKARIREELQAAEQWIYKPAYSGPRFATELLAGEFLAESEQTAKAQARLSRITAHALDQVRFYRNLPWKPAYSASGVIDPASWLQLPLLQKKDLIAEADALRADSLLDDEQLQGFSRTSGTTGEPVSVQHSNASRAMFAWLKQRELRWFRFDPKGVHLSIRPGEELARTREGNRWPDGRVLRMANWPYLQQLFETGPAYGFASTNPVAKQLEILEKIQPDYLLMEPATLENLALQNISRETTGRLRAVQSISQTLTSEMLQTVSKSLRAPVLQNYGLNEIGLVASMCREGQRYHVHQEHCFVELIGESGEPVAPGERGKLVVSSLRNSAMPLLRYDTADSAELADRNCPCGRSLLSFTKIEGRYRRLAQLPEGSYQRFKAIQQEVNRLTREHQLSISQYQVVQDKDGDFMIIVDCGSEDFELLLPSLQIAYTKAWPAQIHPGLTCMRGNGFRGLEKRKFQIFYSELMPDM